jgi:alanine racemase
MRPIKALISIDAMAHNLRVARQYAGSAKVIAVVKANAYGHGLSRAVRALAATDAFAVLTVEEAANLRQMGVRQPILLLEGLFSVDELQVCAELDLWPMIHCRQQLDWLIQQPPPKPLNLFVKFDSGMHRLGFALSEMDTVLAELKALPAVADITLMTHFAQADEAAGIADALRAFRDDAAPTQLPWTTANSAALLRYSEACGDWVRPGIMLYGASPFAETSAADLGLKPAMTLTSEIIAVQTLRAGDGVGYGLSYRAQQDMRIGIVACGYADGYPRHTPTGTPILVDSQRTRTLGRVSMDMLCVDLGDIPQATIGSPVLLWGAGLPVEEVAHAAGTISYELLCALAARVPVEEI